MDNALFTIGVNMEVMSDVPETIPTFANVLHNMRGITTLEGAPGADDPFMVVLKEPAFRAINEQFDDAEAVYQTGGPEAGWYLLVLVARKLGYENGLRSAAYSVSQPLAEQSYKENGAAGGRQKGLNAKLAQARAVARLQDATPEGGWTSLFEFERALAQALRDEGLNPNPTQLAKAMKVLAVAAMAKGLR